MDDDKKNEPQMQQGPVAIPNAGPIFETVPVEGSETAGIQPEELPPEVVNPDEAVVGGYQSAPPVPPPPVYREPSKLPIVIAVVVVFFICAIGLFFLFGSLLKRGPQSNQAVTLVYWGLWENGTEYEELFTEFEKQNPGVTIRYEKKTAQDYRQKLISWIEQGQGPDLFRFHNTWLPQLKTVVSAAPASVITYEDYEKTFYPVHIKDLTMEKKIYGIPLYVDGLVLLCNEDLLKKAGVSTFPTTWDDLLQIAEKVLVKDKDGRVITAGFAAGTATNTEHFADIFSLMLLLNGGSLSDLGAQEATVTLEAYRRFAEPPYNTWSDQLPNSIAAFEQEKVAMIIAPVWELYEIRTTAPDLKIKVVPIPKLPDGKSLSLATYWSEGVSLKSKHSEIAWKLLTFMSSKKSLERSFKKQTDVRKMGGAYPRKDMANLLIQDAYLGAIIRQAQDGSLVSVPSVTRTFDGGLNDEIVRYLENAINAASQGVSYDEALKTAKEGVTQTFQRYNIK